MDVGSGFWPLAGAIAADAARGPGQQRSIREFADASLDYVGGVYYPLIETWFERVSAAIIYFEDTLGLTWTHEELVRNARVGLPGGLSMAYRRSIWQRAGEFSEWAKKGQDRLFSQRVVKIGGKIGMTLHAPKMYGKRLQLLKEAARSHLRRDLLEFEGYRPSAALARSRGRGARLAAPAAANRREHVRQHRDRVRAGNAGARRCAMR